MPPVDSDPLALGRSPLAPGSGWRRILGYFAIVLLFSAEFRVASSYSPGLIVVRLLLAAAGAGAYALSHVLSGVLPDVFSLPFR